VRLAALLVLVEAAALAALAVSMLIEVILGDSTLVGPTVVMALMFLGAGAILGVAARAAVAGRRWSRGVLITWQLLMVAVGLSLMTTLAWWVTLLLVGLPIPIVVCLVVSSSTTWFVPDDAATGA